VWVAGISSPKKFALYIYLRRERERRRIKIKGPANFAHARRHWSGETFPPAAKLPLNLFLEKKKQRD
jgi:hypothetical protein